MWRQPRTRICNTAAGGHVSSRHATHVRGGAKLTCDVASGLEQPRPRHWLVAWLVPGVRVHGVGAYKAREPPKGALCVPCDGSRLSYLHRSQLCRGLGGGLGIVFGSAGVAARLVATIVVVLVVNALYQASQRQ